MSERPAPRLRTVDRQRIIPAMPLEDLLDTDHQARLVWDFCLGLDLTPLYDSIRSRVGGPGHPAIDPRICVAVWLYATLEGVGSARALAWLCQNHNAFRWLTGGVSVNHHTLSDFRVGHLEFLDDLLTHSVAVLREQDLVDLNRVATDGMRVRASAGAASFRRQQTLAEHLQEARDQVARLKEELDDDPSAGSRQQAAARERAARQREERIHQALARLPQLQAKKKPDEKDKARASTTDPEATVMKMADGGYRPAYNIEYAATTDGQVIVGAITELFHDFSGFSAVFGDIRIVPRKRHQYLRRHAPKPLRQGLHDAADLALPLVDDLIERVAVQAQGHRPPQLGLVEWRGGRVDQHIAGYIGNIHFTDRLRRLRLDIFELRDRDAKIDVVLARDKGKQARRDVRDDRVFDAV